MKRKALALTVLVPALLGAGVLTHTVSFSPTEVRLSRFLDYDVVVLERGLVKPDPGKPCLPLVTVTLVIPADAGLSDVDVTPERTQELSGRFNVLPSQLPRPISARSRPEFIPPDPAVYSLRQPFPTASRSGYSTGKAGGFQLAAVTFCPFEYLPAEGRLSLHTRVRVTVRYEDHAAAAQPLTLTQRDRLGSSLARLVANGADLGRFAPPVVELDPAPIDYLVITSDAQAAAFAPFLEYRTRRGLRAELRTVEWASRNYPGRDAPEKLRNCIRDYFTNRGLTYVLLAGDNAQVPCRRIHVNVGNEPGEIPTDLYYADLDYSWDSNGNNRFGEMGDSVDLYADVFLGRAPVDNPAQIQNFLAKVETYETGPAADYIRRSLLPSGWLWRSIGYHGRFVNDSIANITPAGWIDRKLENPAGAQVVADSFERGFALFDPAGHGNYGGVYDEDGTPIYTNGVAGSQRNDRRFSVMTSLACNPGDFESEDCLAEVSLNCPAGGSIAVMMNSRYGWGTPPSMGPSEKLCIRFYDFYLQHGEFLLGPCHSRSREVYADAAQWSSLWRWCLTEFNLFGDPALDLWTEPPAPLDLSSADTILTGGQTISATVTSSGSPRAGVRVCAFKEREVFAVGHTGSGGQVRFTVHPFTAGTLALTATAHDFLPAFKNVVVIPGPPEPHLVYQRHALSDAGQPFENGILEPGETGSLTIVVRNAGAAPTTSASLVLRSASPSVTVLDSLAALGPVPAGDSAQASDLTIAASPNAIPGSSVELLAVVTSAEGSWELPFVLDLGYPGRVWAEIDTGACALTISARGSIGYDTDQSRQGRGFRFPKTDTSCLQVASFCLGTGPDYVVDRFYNTTFADLDSDWRLAESLRALAPLWNADEALRTAFTDAGHPQTQGLRVGLRALGLADPELAGCVVLVYDITNPSPNPVSGLHAGVLADFDVKATDRLHDLAYTLPELNTAFMRSVTPLPRFCGLKLLSPPGRAALACLDHSRYVYPDSGLSEDMKFRLLSGSLGLARADRPFNWSVAASFGPFELAPLSGRQRLGFAFIAAEDSLSYLAACTAVQEWFDANVALSEPIAGSGISGPRWEVTPNPFTASASIRFAAPVKGPVVVSAYDVNGRLVELVHSGPLRPGQSINWHPQRLPAGVYVLRTECEDAARQLRVVLVR